MKETETQVKSINVENGNTEESKKTESLDSWNQERSEDDLDSFLERRLGALVLAESVELAA